MKFSKQLLLIPLLLLLAITTMAQGFGNFGSAVFFQKNGQFDIYNVTGSGPNIIGPGGPNFTGDLGTFNQNSGDLILKGAEVKTFKDANGNVCGSDFFYNIHPQGTPTGTYTDMNLPYKAGCANGVFTDGLGPCSGNDQKWNKESANEDLTNRCPGTYVMDIYYKTPGSASSTSGCNESADIGSATSPAGSMTFTIVGTPLNATVNAGAPTCQGTPANLTSNVTGGSSPYTYSWTGPNGFSSTASSPSVTTPGTYNLTVTDHCGVTTTVQTTVTFKPTPMAPSVTSSATTCPGGTATLMANGCNGTVTWSNGMTGATITAGAGSYTATCTVDGCASSASSSVTVAPCPPPCAPPTICVGPTACPSGLATVTATGCNGAVTWSNGMTGSSITVPPGTYTATCTVNGVTSAPSAPVTVAPCPSNNPCPPYPPPPPPPPPPCSSTGNLLINGSFETPTNAYYAVSHQNGWTNEGPGNSGYLEVWKSGVEGIGAPSGSQFVEMNYLTLGIITQRVTVKKNVPVNLSYYHRSRRAAGGEKMRVDIMDMTTNTVIHSYESTSTAAWKKFKTVFVPTSTDIQVRLVSMNTCNGGTADAGCGNLLDNVVMNYSACECTTVPDAPVICAPVTDLCSNGSVTITAQGCVGGTIRWSNGQTGPTLTTNVPGKYTAQCIMPGMTCESAPSNPVTLLGCTDVSVSCPTFEWKTNGVYHIKFCVKNNGYSPASGTAYYKVNGVVVYSEAYTNLAPGASKCFIYRTRFVPCGSMLNVEVGSTVIGTDMDPSNNTCTCSKPMTCVCNPPPYDPNYKDAMPKRNLEGGIFKTDEWLTYTVHCQNDGLGIAHNVIMIDTLDTSKLDANSIEILGSKDPVEFRRIADNIVAFDFIGVGLTSSHNDLPRSQTEVIFKIKRLPGQEVGTEILNKVGIYFDHEAVVETELAASKIIEPCAGADVQPGKVLNDLIIQKGTIAGEAFKLSDYDGIVTGWQLSTDPAFANNVKTVNNYTDTFGFTTPIDSVTYLRALVQTGGCASAPSAKATIYPVCGNMIENGSFEKPDLEDKQWALKTIPGWTNMADNNTIEIQKDLHAKATDGTQYAELNGNNYGTIYQDIAVISGKTISWRLDHKARAAMNEIINITLSAPDGSNAKTFTHKGSPSGWETIGSRYLVNEEQTMVRIKIASTVSSSPSSGNFIDNIVVDYADCSNPLMAPAALMPVSNHGGVASVGVQPNPVVNTADVDLTGYDDGDVNLMVTDASGRSLKTMQYHYTAGTKYTLDLSDLASGIYLIKAQQKGKVATTKVVKK